MIHHVAGDYGLSFQRGENLMSGVDVIKCLVDAICFLCAPVQHESVTTNDLHSGIETVSSITGDSPNSSMQWLSVARKMCCTVELMTKHKPWIECECGQFSQRCGWGFLSSGLDCHVTGYLVTNFLRQQWSHLQGSTCARRIPSDAMSYATRTGTWM